MGSRRRGSFQEKEDTRGETERSSANPVSRIDAFTRGRSKLYDETKSMFGPQEPTEYLSISVARDGVASKRADADWPRSNDFSARFVRWLADRDT